MAGKPKMYLNTSMLNPTAAAKESITVAVSMTGATSERSRTMSTTNTTSRTSGATTSVSRTAALWVSSACAVVPPTSA